MNQLFDVEEYKARHTKAIQLMGENNLDALLITAETNINYFSGYKPWASWTTFTRPSLLIIPKRQQPVLVVQDIWTGAARKDSWIEDVRGYMRLSELPFDIISDVFQGLGIDKGRIGAELGYEQRLGISYNDFTQVQSILPKCKFVDASHLLWNLRMFKSSKEINYIKQACKATSRVFENAFENIKEGMTEKHVEHCFHLAAAEEKMEIGFIIAVSGSPNYHAMASRPSNRKIEKGDMIWVDLSLICCDYRSDFSRAAVIGDPSDNQRTTWEKVHQITMKGIEQIKPGVSIKEIVKACSEEASRIGLDLGSFSTGRLGHGIGLMTTEPPHIGLYDSNVLEVGMVLALEPGIINDEGVFVVEQDVAVTENGYEILTDGFWELKSI